MGKPSEKDLRHLLEPYREGDLEKAARAARKFTRRWPSQTRGWQVLGDSLYRLGELDGAIEALGTAARCAPEDASIRDALGLALLANAQAPEAEQAFTAGLAWREDDPALLTHLGLAVTRQQRYREGERTLQRALALQPARGEALEALGHNLRHQGRYREAVTVFRRAASRLPGNARAHSDLGNTLREIEDHDAAQKALRRAAEIAPTDPGIQCDLGVVEAERGATEAAATAFGNAVELDPSQVQAHVGLARTARLESLDVVITGLRRQLERANWGDWQRSRLHYAVAHALQRQDAAVSDIWAEVQAGAQSRRRMLPYDPERQERHFGEIESVFTREWLERYQLSPGSGEPRPLFIVGMPRSGTTLVERTLAAHPRIASAGERGDIPRLITDVEATNGLTFPAEWDRLPSSEIGRIAERYRREVLAPQQGVDWVIDKQPENFRYLGLIAAAMPEAMILHVERDPVDTCLSCYMQDFVAPLSYSNDLAHLGHYYQLYQRLMQHWRRHLDGQAALCEVRYEDWVADLQGQATAVLETLGLDWDARCATFHQAPSPIRTASLTQVRQPVYADAIGRWWHYRQHLGPLFEALGAYAPHD